MKYLQIFFPDFFCKQNQLLIFQGSFFAFLLFITQSLFAQVSADSGYLVKIGDKAPDLLLHLTDGSQISVNELSGKVVVLQFTASWCSACRKEMPHLENEVWLPNKDNNFLLIGVDYDEPVEKVIAFQQQMKTTYPMALDPGAEIFSQFARKGSGVTRNVVIDQNGTIQYLTRLFDPEEFEEMKAKIDSLLDQ